MGVRERKLGRENVFVYRHEPQVPGDVLGSGCLFSFKLVAPASGRKKPSSRAAARLPRSSDPAAADFAAAAAAV